MPHPTPHPRLTLTRITLTAAALSLAACLGDIDCDADPSLAACCDDCKKQPYLLHCPFTCGDYCDCPPRDLGSPCLDDRDCGDTAPFCAQGVCVVCSTQTDCKDPTSSTCDRGDCRGCTADVECAHLGATQVCDTETNRCVVCTGRNPSACGSNVCDPSTNTCSNRGAATRGVCEECLTGRECTEGMLCAATRLGDVDTGAYCLFKRDAAQSLGGPGGTCATAGPYSEERQASDVGGTSTAPICQPPRTTCSAINWMGTTCINDDDCGAPGVDDGLCRPDSGGRRKCTIPCTANRDCEAPSTCVMDTIRYCSAS